MSSSHFNYSLRMQKILSFIESYSLDYLIITNLQNIFWLSGTAQYGVLLIHRSGDYKLFIRRNIHRARKESALSEIIELKKTNQILTYVKSQNTCLENLKIGMELDSLPASYFLSYKKMFNIANIINIEFALRKLRMVKDSAELEIHRDACKVAQKVQERIPRILKPGIKEYEVAAEIMYESMKNKSLHFSIVNGFLENWFILASGENLWIPSSFPILAGSGFTNAVPYGYNEREIQKGDIVMCDYGLIFKGYHADHARTYYLDPIPDKFKERYTILKDAYIETVEDFLRAGNPVHIIYDKMKSILDKYNLGNFFEGDGNYYQGLGHGLGLELDEPPFIVPQNNDVLEENMVISLEPKIIIPNWGAIDLEDNFIIKKGKPERITKTPYLFD
ncbi:MAG: M24 family metallopeptidase [Promethearchaeota archaeon]